MKITVYYIVGFVSLLLLTNMLAAAEYKVAVRAHHGVEVAIKQWQPTIDAISKKIPEHTFTLLPILSLEEITERAGKNDYQFVLTNPSSFVEIKELYGAENLATLNNKRENTAQSRFGSVIFTHVRNENILSIKDLKNKTLIVVSESAFGGWRVAWLEMLEKGFDPKNKLKKLMYTKNKTQSAVVKAVYDGTADAGVVRTDLLERMEASGKIDMRYFRIIENKEISDFPFFISTKLYPEWAFAVMKPVSAEINEKVKKVLLEISDKSTAAKAGKYIGWTTSLNYSSVRNLMLKLKVGPFSSSKNRKGNAK